MKKFLSLLLVFSIIAVSCGTTAFCAVDTMYEDSKFYSFGDYEIHYRIIPHKGEFKGRIMMLHGFLCSTYAWRNMADTLSKAGYECVLADLPNFGYSTRETPETKITDREELIIGLMNSIDPNGKWIVAGHSMGGGVATNIAQEKELSALLLYCPAPQSTMPEGMNKIMNNSVMRFIMENFFKYGTRISFLVRIFVYAATRNLDFAKEYDLKGLTDPFNYEGIGSGMCQMMTTVRPTALETADKIKCPVLLINADGDIIISESMENAFKEAFPDAEKHTVEGGHQCIEDRSDVLCEITLEFLQK
ncbi:MAG: alpha/beta hydrolase [Clostridia bacterium]|nr:alpha/beta hydrolase [Clostridia bacterium]